MVTTPDYDLKKTYTMPAIPGYFDIDSSRRRNSVIGAGDSPPPLPVPFPVAGSQRFKYFRAKSWDSTPLGSLKQWPEPLRLAATSVLSAPIAMAFFWGPELINVHNEEFERAMLRSGGCKHCSLGLTYEAAWGRQSPPHITKRVRETYIDGSVWKEERQQIFVAMDNDELEERYLDFACWPLIGSNGLPLGVFLQVTPRSIQVTYLRGLGALQCLGDGLAGLQSVETQDFWDTIGASFENVAYDAPFLMAYEYKSGGDMVLRSSMGIAVGSKLAPRKAGKDWVLADEARWVLENREANLKIELEDSMREGDPDKHRGFEEFPSKAVLIPILSSMGPVGLLVMGLNPRRPYDHIYEQWIHLLRRELCANADRITLLNIEKRRAMDAEELRMTEAEEHQMQVAVAAKKTAFLKSELEARTEELKDSEMLFLTTARRIKVGIMVVDSSGNIFFANDAFHGISGLPKVEEDNSNLSSWMEHVHCDSREMVKAAYLGAIETKTELRMEFGFGSAKHDCGCRWKKWVSCVMTPEKEKGSDEVRGFLMTIADITSVKLAEERERVASNEAEKRRKQLETFVDMFSHELRNPFSAILQCVDEIHSELSGPDVTAQDINISEISNSVSTILMCVQHQIRILDDVLTLSKVDSLSVRIIPTAKQPLQLLHENLRIYHSEVQAKDITITPKVDESFTRLGMDWASFDTIRWSQIMVNLLSNAIKFTTQKEGKKEISVVLAATESEPLRFGDVEFSGPPEHPEHAFKATADLVYIVVSIEDNGIGIKKRYQRKLFDKYEQAPKTHSNYGGSGLGLFVSRKLAQLQGGDIGLHSVENVGSTFCYYIKAYRTKPPKDVGAASTSPSPGSSPVMKGKRGSFSAISRSSTFSSTMSSGILATSMTSTTLKEVETKLSLSIAQKTQRTDYRVLIVEDNLINQQVMKRQLVKAGCIVTTVANGQEAVDAIIAQGTGEAIDVVLMDKEMPVMDGNQATLEIRRLQREGIIKRHVPILGISANARPQQIAEMVTSGMDDAVSKPFKISQVLEKFPVLCADRA